uniref:Checkpoint kinase 2 n=1 Tax=Astyanax mexicanus TaxID=7994 RepID=A0A8B9HG49_ASTMX
CHSHRDRDSAVYLLPVSRIKTLQHDVYPFFFLFSADCVDNVYCFGRDSRCDYAFKDPAILNSPRYKTYSKRHFKIFRDGDLAYLQDLSGNGTWVDDTEVGKGKKIPLNNNSVVSLADPKHKVFMYVDMNHDEQPNFPKEFREKYHVTRKIGSGVCGEVRLAIERETCKKVALKTINKNDFPSVGTATRNAEREIEILKKIDHPCLIRTEDFYQTEESYYIVLEYVEGGELFTKIKTEKQLKEEIAKLYFYQMLKAVEVSQIFYHFLKASAKIRYLNLSLSLFLLFSLFPSLGGYPPFNTESSPLPVREQIINGQYCFIRSQWKSVSNAAKDLVKKLLVVDPVKRISISEALQHPWLNDVEMRRTAHTLMNLENTTQATNPATAATAASVEPTRPARVRY